MPVGRRPDWVNSEAVHLEFSEKRPTSGRAHGSEHGPIQHIKKIYLCSARPAAQVELIADIPYREIIYSIFSGT